MPSFTGSNGFGQFGSELVHRSFEFMDFSVGDLADSDADLLASVTWLYGAFASGSKLLLRGGLSNKPDCELKLSTSDPIKQLATSDDFCLVLLESGKLFKLRPEVDAQLEEIKFAALAMPVKRSFTGDVKEEKPPEIAYVACGQQISVAVSRTNTVFSIPNEVHQFPAYFRVKQLVCGFEHALLLNANGDIYSWGNGYRGQLATENMEVEESPVLIEALGGVRMTHIAAAGWHSAAISAFQDVYVWGWNSNGQLAVRVFDKTDGLKAPAVYDLPHVLDLPQCCPRNDETSTEAAEGKSANEVAEDSECAPVKVFAGARHTVLQRSCGAIWAVGWNAHGQLGIKDWKQLNGDKEFCDNFQKVTTCKDEKLRIICGAWSTILVK